MTTYQVVGHPSQTGTAVYVSRIEQLARFKGPDLVHGTDGVYTIDRPVVITVPSTIFGPFSVGNCRFEFTTTGVLQSYSPTACAITAGGLNPAVPFITARSSAVIKDITIVGVGTVFDLDGGAFIIYALIRVVVVASGVGAIKNFSGLIVELCQFIQCGNMEISGTYDVVSLRSCLWQPVEGATALSFPSGSITRTIDIVFSSIILDFVSSSGVAADPGLGLKVEGLHWMRLNFSRSPAGEPDGTPLPPIGTPIPPGMLDANSNLTKIVDCDHVENSAEASYDTMQGNVVVTDTSLGSAKVAGPTISRVARKFEHPVGRPNHRRFIGARDGLFDIEFKASATAQANKLLTFYVAIGDDDSPLDLGGEPIAVVADESKITVPTGGGGAVAAVAIGHMVDMSAAKHTFVELWVDSTGTSPTVVSLNGKVKRVPA